MTTFFQLYYTKASLVLKSRRLYYEKTRSINRFSFTLQQKNNKDLSIDFHLR